MCAWAWGAYLGHHGEQRQWLRRLHRPSPGPVVVPGTSHGANWGVFTFDHAFCWTWGMLTFMNSILAIHPRPSTSRAGGVA